MEVSVPFIKGRARNNNGLYIVNIRLFLKKSVFVYRLFKKNVYLCTIKRMKDYLRELGYETAKG